MAADTPTRPPSEAALELGAKLRELRLAQRVAGGSSRLTQDGLAQHLLVGGKGVVSQFESGRRLPSEDVLRAYAQLPGADTDVLVRLRERVVAERSTGSSPAIAVGPPPGDSTTSLRLGRRNLALGAALLVAAGSAAAVVAVRRDEDEGAEILSPRSETEERTAVIGSVHGLADHDLWLDVQSVDETRHHPAETPCDRSGDTFSFDELVVGTPDAAGQRFRVSVLAVERGGEAEAALFEYADRPKDQPSTYVGLASLPVGTRVMASTVLLRR